MRFAIERLVVVAVCCGVFQSGGWGAFLQAQQQQAGGWQYSAELLRPFWQGRVVDGESVLFVRDADTGVARGQLLYPIEKIVRLTTAADWRQAGGVVFEEGRDYVFERGGREIVLPVGSRVPSFTADQLRRPAGSQKYRLTHRDGNGEIFFAAGAEYHQMQAAVTYEHAVIEEDWSGVLPKYDAAALPRTTERLQRGQGLSIVLLGDSISTGCNA
ncbi:MAG: hypothetical protein ACKPJJ_23460, partial [Planctomycetaceae bacterium]